ncbi:hypothetical protein ACFSC1_14020 [Paracoccus aurantiacus]|uniref:hypothetical protein n=1 Tax=Paracoccus aurantiacus TaxID=2599412 RepID=UPI001FE3B8E4|nr:hypothetical protein [Paracoccus aurantiacus]
MQIAFANGRTLDFDARGGEVLLDNYSTAGMGATALFVDNTKRGLIFSRKWRTREDSNLWPLPSEGLRLAPSITERGTP